MIRAHNATTTWNLAGGKFARGLLQDAVDEGMQGILVLVLEVGHVCHVGLGVVHERENQHLLVLNSLQSKLRDHMTVT